MENKEQALLYVKSLAEQKILTREELIASYDSASGIVEKDSKKIGIAEILYYIGGGIVFLGIVILVFQNWDTFGFATKLLATLGAGIAAYVTGVLFAHDPRTENVGSAFYLISALVMPVGLFVVLDHAGIDTGTAGAHSFVSIVLFVTYIASYFVFRKNLFIFFSIVFGTWFFFTITSLLISGGPAFDTANFYEYRILIVALSYILMGYYFAREHTSAISNFLYNFGIIGLLGSALALGGWTPEQHAFWELVYPLLVFGAIFASIYIKNKTFLTWGTIFLMIYIMKITGEYFSTGLGWPLALVLAGLAMIGVGYMSVSLKKKYLTA